MLWKYFSKKWCSNKFWAYFELEKKMKLVNLLFNRNLNFVRKTSNFDWWHFRFLTRIFLYKISISVKICEDFLLTWNIFGTFVRIFFNYEKGEKQKSNLYFAGDLRRCENITYTYLSTCYITKAIIFKVPWKIFLFSNSKYSNARRFLTSEKIICEVKFCTKVHPKNGLKVNSTNQIQRRHYQIRRRLTVHIYTEFCKLFDVENFYWPRNYTDPFFVLFTINTTPNCNVEFGNFY